ncbi:MAG: alpha-amylase, partial [Betaproteobacteria bacterium]|nr:alpha-amylase [Betaproteobacteria bacterium]
MKQSSCTPHHPWVIATLCGITIALAAAMSPHAHADSLPAPQPLAKSRDMPPTQRVSALPAGWQYGAFMEIFVRAYQDSNGDGIGDLRGLISRLDYLRDLGIKGIWLMPITTSRDHDHGYATTDYRAIEPDYGTLADFDELLKQAHARGIGVIVDYVVNHAAITHPLFEQSASSVDNPYRDWFVWQAAAPTGWDIWGKNPWTSTANGAYFATFGPHMPDFNLRNPAVLDYHQDSLRFWLDRGLDGFRLDAMTHLIENDSSQWNDQPESRALTHQFQTLINSYPRRYTVCEATANPMIYAAAEVCGSAFGFGHEHHIVEAAKGQPEAIQAVADYFKTAPANMVVMVSNHDRFAGARLWDQVQGDLAQYRLAAATYLLQPGIPFIYYGEEIGMAGIPELKGDAELRTPMSWRADAKGFTRGKPFRPLSPNAATHNAAAERRNPQSLWAFYKAMLALRNTRPSIAQGSYDAPFVQGQVLGFQRSFQREKTWVLINYGTSDATVSLEGLPAGAKLQALYPK